MPDDQEILTTLARLRRVREMRSQLARVAAARQQGIAAESRRALVQAQDGLTRQIEEKAAIQQRLAAVGAREASARTLQDAAVDARSANVQIGAANRSLADARTHHDGNEVQLAQLQHAARRAKAAEDKLEKAGERHTRSLAARTEQLADEVADGFAVRRFGAQHALEQDEAEANDNGAPAPYPRPGGRC
ncbi:MULTISPECIES: hypothetical protein [Paraburkholderia]|uniref:hypothetical protein n=1 Tax=Paraburkholderia TaxID=1822464 RepID=UPI00225ACA3E|nr:MULTISPECIES: hypothetical protein [Paraburkholderia]MCX4173935.1 hypothetical protein [Paraburkholderia madseniana]MDQ6461939.1 hypothetical protein [Paraburkholderia madseniana]